MNMQQMMMQAQKMQRELAKALAELDAEEFTLSKGGAVTITMFGSHEIKTVDIDKDALEPDNKEMLEEMIALVINELIGEIDKARGDINESITGRRSGF